MTPPFSHPKISFDQLPAAVTTEGDHQQSSFSLVTSSPSSTSPCPPYYLFDTQHQPHAGALHHDHQEMKGSAAWCNYGGIHQSSSDHPQKGPVKWMSSKMRIMRKMMINSYHQTTPTTAAYNKPRRCNNHHLHGQDQKKANLAETIIRVCSDCNTTKTPLWRSGPCGPKSLCNACGIRQRKARRAMAASSSGAGKDKELPAAEEVDRRVPFKKRCRFSAADTARDQRKKKVGFEDIVIRLSNTSAFHRVFPQDEKEAAILLMALSTGLLCTSS